MVPMPTLPSASTERTRCGCALFPGPVSGVVERLEVALGFECTLAARTGRGNRLAVVVVGDIADGEDAGDVGGGASGNGLQVAVLFIPSCPLYRSVPGR